MKFYWPRFVIVNFLSTTFFSSWDTYNSFNVYQQKTDFCKICGKNFKVVFNRIIGGTNGLLCFIGFCLSSIVILPSPIEDKREAEERQKRNQRDKEKTKHRNKQDKENKTQKKIKTT